MDAEAEEARHASAVASMTGGMAPAPPTFAGSDRLHPDGRPKSAFRDELRRVNDGRNALAVAATIASPVLVVGVAVDLSHPVAWVLAFLTMPVVQNRLFILHHEAAHRTLFSSLRLNDLVGINLIGWLTFGTGGHGYRIGHIHHHRDEFGPKEPDFLLYSQYPITAASMGRKHRRDLTGVSAYRIVRPRFQRLGEVRHRRLTYRFLAGQALVLGAFWTSGRPWLYLLLWVLPWATLYQCLNRLRAIAEHGGMTRSEDRRRTTHHVRQRPLARALMVPFGVGYHLAHHADMTVPYRNLPRLHAALAEDGYVGDLEWPTYRALWRALRSRDAGDSAELTAI
ncbi:MAG: fatty acid desaturase [Actinomycetota bacterium]|nr:fatty acid desaturase [Actinomycetota bacterium]